MTSRGGSIAVSGAGGRLGSALVRALEHDPRIRLHAWHRDDLDLDEPAAPTRLIARDRPGLVVHTAAWTDVDGCARDPGLAMRRNADAVDHLARACAMVGSDLLLVSTNEVFDGDRTDGKGYREDDPTHPRNPYGASKVAGEAAARAAFSSSGSGRLWIVRVAWLFGPPGDDFPHRIIAAADRLPAGEAVPVVRDEHGSPTSTADLAPALLALVDRTDGGTYHLAGDPPASRLEWARAVLAVARPERRLRPISRDDFARGSDPPPWGVLDTTKAAAVGVRVRGWRAATTAAMIAEAGTQVPRNRSGSAENSSTAR